MIEKAAICLSSDLLLEVSIAMSGYKEAALYLLSDLCQDGAQGDTMRRSTLS